MSDNFPSPQQHASSAPWLQTFTDILKERAESIDGSLRLRDSEMVIGEYDPREQALRLNARRVFYSRPDGRIAEKTLDLQISYTQLARMVMPTVFIRMEVNRMVDAIREATA